MGMGIAEGFSTVLEAGFDKMPSVGRVCPFKVLDNGRAKLCTASAPHTGQLLVRLAFVESIMATP